MAEPTTAVPAPRRSPWRRRLLLAGLALVALLVLAVALAPSVAAAMLPGRVEAAFAERFHGRLEVGDVDLGWGGRQSVEGVRLLDPEGGEVARVALELPGLWALVRGRGKDLGHVRVVVANAELAADAEGRSNLERALEPRTPADEPAPGEEEGGESPLADLECDVELVVQRLTWTDPRTPEPFALEDFTARATLDGAGAAVVESAGRIQGGAENGLKIDARAQNLFAKASSDAPPTIELDAALRDLPMGLVDALAGQGGLLRDVLGERATLTVQAHGTPRAGSATLALEAERGHVRARGEIADGVLRARDGFALEAQLDVPAVVWQAWVAPLLPPDMAVAPAGAGVAVRATATQLVVPVARIVDAAAAEEDVVALAARESELTLEVTLGDLTVGTSALPQPLAFTAPELVARLAPAANARRLELELRAGVAGGEEAGIAVRAASGDAAGLIAAVRGGAPAPLEARVDLKRLDSGLVTAQLGEGPAKELFGPHFDLELAVDGTFATQAATALHATLQLATRGETLSANFDVALPEGPAAAPLTLRGDVRALAFARPLVPEAWRATADELLGDTLTLDVATRAPKEGELEVDATATAARLRATAALAQGPEGLATRGERGVELVVRPSNATIARHLAASLPAGATAELLEDGAALELVVRELAWPAVEPAEGVDPTAAALAQAHLDAALKLPGVRLTSPAASKGAAPVPVELVGLQAHVALAPERGFSASATSRLAGAQEDTLDLKLDVPRPAEWLAEDTKNAAFALELSCRAVPTALVDALAAQDGLVVDVLGATADVEFEARRPSGAEGLKLALRSPQASLDLVGQLGESTLRSGKKGGLSASMPLTPLYTQRIVGNLLPMLVGLSKPAGAPPAALSVTDFVLPFSGNLSKLDAQVTLDLNQVTYDLLPGLAGLLANAAGGKSFVVPPINLAVEKGVVRYDAMPLTIAGHTASLGGSFDLVSREMDLRTELPLSIVGESALGELKRANIQLDPSTPVPLRISGTPKKPRITIEKDFLENVLEQAAKGALEKGLGELLERARKKDG